MSTQTAPQQATGPVVVRSDEGEARWVFGSLVVLKATAADTAGQLTLLEGTDPPGAETPLSVSHNYDLGYWILDGATTLEAGETTVEARPGDFVWVPRGVPHRTRVGAEGCRYLMIITPGGLERMFDAVSNPAETRDLPPSADGPLEPEEFLALVRSYGMELLE
jgi:mannose-6-phosphate isomerase-like protein (cupin superfamily)